MKITLLILAILSVGFIGVNKNEWLVSVDKKEYMLFLKMGCMCNLGGIPPVISFICPEK